MVWSHLFTRGDNPWHISFTMNKRKPPKKPSTDKIDRQWMDVIVKLFPWIARIVVAFIVHWWK
jgi:hypothetical protein